MSRIIFLLEEYSMKVLLDGLIPRLFPGLNFLCIPHEGKRDLEKSIPRKLRGWNVPGDGFIIIRDNDQSDCISLKERLVTLCPPYRRDDSIVRIACQELEAWYIGDPDALADAYDNERLRTLHRKRRFWDPDMVAQPAHALEQLIPEFQKVSGAGRMASRLSKEKNRSRSFQVLIEGISQLSRRIGYTGI